MKKLTETRPKVSFAVLILGLAATSFATAADVNVPTTGNPTIQAAVDAATTNDTIHIAIYLREVVGGRIAGNTISGFSYVGTGAVFPISFGILADNVANYPPVIGHLQPLTIEGNTLRDNQFPIALVNGDGSVVRNNRFQGTAPGIIPVGLAVTWNECDNCQQPV